MKGTEEVMMNVGGKFWTRQNEMIEEVENLGYEMIEFDGDYLTVVDLQDGETEYTLHVVHANDTMWFENAE